MPMSNNVQMLGCASDEMARASRWKRSRACGSAEKPGKGAKKGRKDGVDDLLTDAEKSGPMPETKIKHETPEWAKPEIRESAPATRQRKTSPPIDASFL